MTSTLQSTSNLGQNGGQIPAPPGGRPMTIKSRRSWRPNLLALSLFLIVGSMLAGLWLYQSATSRVGILVAATDLQPGDQLTVGDTRVQYVASEPEFLSTLFTEDQANTVGFYADGIELVVDRSIPAGAPLVRSYLTPKDEVIPGDKAVVGLQVNVGAYPNLIEDGDTVAMFSSPNDDDILAATPLGTAEVWSVVIDPNNGNATIDLIVDIAQQDTVVQAHRNDLLRLTFVDGGS